MLWASEVCSLELILNDFSPRYSICLVSLQFNLNVVLLLIFADTSLRTAWAMNCLSFDSTKRY